VLSVTYEHALRSKRSKVIQSTAQTAYGSRGEGLKLVTKLSKALCTVFKVVPKYRLGQSNLR